MLKVHYEIIYLEITENSYFMSRFQFIQNNLYHAMYSTGKNLKMLLNQLIHSVDYSKQYQKIYKTNRYRLTLNLIKDY